MSIIGYAFFRRRLPIHKWTIKLNENICALATPSALHDVRKNISLQIHASKLLSSIN